MFNQDEAFQFIEDVLKVSSPRSRMSSDRKALLDDFVTAMQTQLLFQNIRLLSQDSADRKRPSLEEIKQDLLSGIGGLCYNMNVAAFYLLQAIGFNAVMVHGSCTTTVICPDNHILVFVRDVEKEGDKFIVEVSVGFPTFRAISFDFEKESPVFRDSFLEYKYIKHDGKLLRMHRKGCPLKTPPDHPCTFILDGWRRLYYAELEGTTDIKDFDLCFDKVFTDPKASPFHLSLRVIGFPSGKAKFFVNENQMMENEEGDLVVTKVEGGDEGILQNIRHVYPVLPEDLIRQALANWRKIYPPAS